MRPDTPISKAFRLKDDQKNALKKLDIETVRDLLFHFPVRYEDIANIKHIKDLEESSSAIIYGKVLSTKTTKAYRKKIPIGEAVIEDDTGKIRATWFNQAYAAKMLSAGDYVKLVGHINRGKDGKLYMGNPEFEKTKALPIDTGDSLFAGREEPDATHLPVYSERRGITSRWVYHAVQKIFAEGLLDELADPLPKTMRETYNLPGLKTALIWIHTPQKASDAEAARKRFAFEEILFIQLTRQQARQAYKAHGSFAIKTKTEDIERFVRRFPFTPTDAQTRAVEAIRADLSTNEPMTRLLEGDVGSGKTFVAAATAYATVTTRPAGQDFGNLQVAYMAPTEILAEQHFMSFIEYFKGLSVPIGLLTGSGCKKFPSKVTPDEPTNISRAQLLKWVANGEIPILIGTHALIQKTVQFQDLAYVIVDEQHRFGTTQRAALTRKDSAGKQRVPHLLSMTATPIPRTLALTIYGDLDLTLLDEQPAGRKHPETKIVTPAERENTYKQLKRELKAGRQVYVICPRIEEPDPDKASALRVRSVKEEAKRLQENVFTEHTVGILHGKMKPKEKEQVMEQFAEKKTDILVATSVVEVGVNVPNATVIVIEGAERFGLAQLHQLRGRVQRSTHQAYCYLFADSPSTSSGRGKTDKTLERLKALTQAKNGFELAELDLQLRGAGELAGNKQWGVSDLGMEAIKNMKMVEAARTEAQQLLESDPELQRHPAIAKRIHAQETDVHFE